MRPAAGKSSGARPMVHSVVTDVTRPRQRGSARVCTSALVIVAVTPLVRAVGGQKRLLSWGSSATSTTATA